MVCGLLAYRTVCRKLERIEHNQILVSSAASPERTAKRTCLPPNPYVHNRLKQSDTADDGDTTPLRNEGSSFRVISEQRYWSCRTGIS
jgi:hypothetical protein